MFFGYASGRAPLVCESQYRLGTTVEGETYQQNNTYDHAANHECRTPPDSVNDYHFNNSASGFERAVNATDQQRQTMLDAERGED
jgi:hypothetical protein